MDRATDGLQERARVAKCVAAPGVRLRPPGIGEEGQPLNAVANQIAKEALADAGAQMVLGAPTKEFDGPTGVVSAPSLPLDPLAKPVCTVPMIP